MSITRHPARSARAIASPKFSSRREELRRQMRVWPPPHSTTASATNAVRLPSCRSNANAPKQAPSAIEQPRRRSARRRRRCRARRPWRPACAGSPGPSSRPRSTCAASGARRRTAGRCDRRRCGRRRIPTRPAPRPPPAPRAPRSRRRAGRRAGSPPRSVSAKCCCHESSGSRVPRAALIPPDASTVCGVEPRPLADDDDLGPRLVRGDRGPQPGPARSRSRGRSPCGCGRAHDQPWVQRDRSAPSRRGRPPRRLRWCQHACGAGRMACTVRESCSRPSAWLMV